MIRWRRLLVNKDDASQVLWIHQKLGKKVNNLYFGIFLVSLILVVLTEITQYLDGVSGLVMFFTLYALGLSVVTISPIIEDNRRKWVCKEGLDSIKESLSSSQSEKK